jgi:branched-subunit amino acid transport protein AzlD
MEDAQGYLIAVMLVMAAATIITRALPFLFLRSLAEHPEFMAFGRRLPAAILAILVIYSLSDVQLVEPPHGLPQLLAGGATLLMHAWRRNALLSIITGTAIFMLLQQSGVLA